MARPALNNASSEVIAKNFLEESPDLTEVSTDHKVVVAKEIPKMQRIVFTNNRDPGVTLHFHYHSKTHPLKHYDLVHGKTYDLPIEVIKHLEGQNEHDPYACHHRLYGRRMKLDGFSETYVNGFVSYFQCKAVRS